MEATATPAKYQFYLGCATPAPEQTCEDICPSGNCLTSYWNGCAGEEPGEVPDGTCGLYEIDGQCCTVAKFFYVCGE